MKKFWQRSLFRPKFYTDYESILCFYVIIKTRPLSAGKVKYELYQRININLVD